MELPNSFLGLERCSHASSGTAVRAAILLTVFHAVLHLQGLENGGKKKKEKHLCPALTNHLYTQIKASVAVGYSWRCLLGQAEHWNTFSIGLVLHLWTDLVQIWCDDWHYWTLHFSTGVSGLRSQECRKKEKHHYSTQIYLTKFLFNLDGIWYAVETC